MSENSRFTKERITILGGGNIGTYFACTAAAKGFEVTVFSSHPEKYSGLLQIVDGRGETVCEGRIKQVTSDMRTAMDTDTVFVIHPAYLFSEDAERMLPYVRKGMKIGAIPGTGGAEFAFRRCLEKGAVLFGLQRVPAVARLVEYGKTVRVEGKRDRLFLAAIPGEGAEELSPFIGDLFDMPCDPLPNYLSVTMTPSNPILHTARLATMFSDYREGVFYERNPLFYGEWSDEASERLLACDAEHQALLRKLDRLDLSSVRSLVEHYDQSDTKEKMTKKLRSIESLHSLSSPMKKTEKGWIPDFSSRYFTADFPYGLAIIEEIAELAGAEIPRIRETMQWYRRVTANDSRLELSGYGIRTPEDLYRIYL